MSMNRIQFQRAMSLPEFLSTYGTEAVCEKALQRGRWPQGFVCPHCGGTRYHRFRRAGIKYLHCRDCRRQTSLVAGTLFACTRLSLTTWFLGLYLLTQTKNGIWTALPANFPDLAALNAWLEARCLALWRELPHPTQPGHTLVEVWQAEQPLLMQNPAPFDGFVEQPKRVTPP